MRQMTVNECRNTLRAAVERVVQDHEPLRVTRGSQEAFIVMSEAEWEREQKAWCVLQNQPLMQQIAESMKTHGAAQGYTPACMRPFHAGEVSFREDDLSTRPQLHGQQTPIQKRVHGRLDACLRPKTHHRPNPCLKFRRFPSVDVSLHG